MEEVLLPLHSKFGELAQRLGGDKDLKVEVGKKEGPIRRSGGAAGHPRPTVEAKLWGDFVISASAVNALVLSLECGQAPWPASNQSDIAEIIRLWLCASDHIIYSCNSHLTRKPPPLLPLKKKAAAVVRCCGESGVTRSWGQPVANNQEEIEVLNPTAERNLMLPQPEWAWKWILLQLSLRWGCNPNWHLDHSLWDTRRKT